MKLVKWILSFLPGGSLRRLANEGREALRTMLDAPYNKVKEMRVRVDFSFFIYLYTLYMNRYVCVYLLLFGISQPGEYL